MRKVVLSTTARDELKLLLAQGVPKFGPAHVARMRDRVFDVIDNHLAHFPAVNRRGHALGLAVYTLRRPPFCVIYDYDDVELRVHFIVHAHSDLTELDPANVIW